MVASLRGAAHGTIGPPDTRRAHVINLCQAASESKENPLHPVHPCYLLGVFGFFNIDKPPGPTSHDIVDRVRKALRGVPGAKRVKVGHAGTLDPFATGVLVICVGAATRLAKYVQRQPKRYLAQITLGATSTTDDPEGEVSPIAGAAPPSQEQIRRVLDGFIGTIEQVPPAHSAVHVEGRRAYKLARSGRKVEVPPRKVEIFALEMISYQWPRVEIDVRCGTGTYIRALARDVGAELGVGGYSSNLTRSEVGPFTLDRSVAVDSFDPHKDLLSPLTALSDLPQVIVGPPGAARLLNGNPIEIENPLEGDEVAVLDESGGLLGIAKVARGGSLLRPKKIFPAE